MSESLRVAKCNLRIVELPDKIRVTKRVGAPDAKPTLVIRRGGRAFYRCHVCGRLRRVAPGDSR